MITFTVLMVFVSLLIGVLLVDIFCFAFCFGDIIVAIAIIWLIVKACKRKKGCSGCCKCPKSDE